MYAGLEVHFYLALRTGASPLTPPFIKRHHQRAERSLKRQIPDIQAELEDSMDTLADLAETLPTTQAQVSDIEKIYDSGRRKVRFA